MQGASSCNSGPDPTGVQAMRLCVCMCVAQRYRDEEAEDETCKPLS
jgi:hypothetical protein